MEEDFQFLLCEKCQEKAKSPKLLPCLHTLCAECLEENKPIGQCPICQISIQRTGGAPLQDNLLFAHLQAKLDTYRKIASGQDLVCDRCRSGAEFWCPKCEEFLCANCHEAHQWYLKQKSHEAQKLSDLKNDSAQSFLEAERKSSHLFCSEPAHSNQLVSIYCRGCRKPLCCSCALLDGEHYNAQLYCDIRMEIENRKEELGRMKEELTEKKRSYESTHRSAHERLQHLQKVRNETQDWIRAQVEEMIQWIRTKGEELMEKVDQQLCQDREDVERKLQSTECVIGRMKASERLVEKMNLFASDQEVMDMQPFIKESLEELRREEVPVVGFQVQMENFGEVKNELQAIYKRMKDEKDAVGCRGSPTPAVNSDFAPEEKGQPGPPGVQMVSPMYTISLANTEHGFLPSITTAVKQRVRLTEKCVQASPKMMKLEDHDSEVGETSSWHVQEIPASTQLLSPQTSTPEKKQRECLNSVEALESPPSKNAERAVLTPEPCWESACLTSSPLPSPPEEPQGAVTSIVITSSDETEDESM